MGVPAFYRWLSNRYPKTIKDCIEDTADVINGVEVPVDTSQPNPNGMEFDNLYLDMNGIIHPCFHPEDRPPPTTEHEVFLTIFDYIDRLFGIVRPRKVLYMAIDGVAPRAKMNQQRSRRFRAAQDAEEQAAEEKRLREELADQGIHVPIKEKGDVFDSNTITPGTPFMHRLSVALQYYIHLRLNSDPGWQKIKVILSDANSPGEGEHKVMAFIREQRSSPSYDPLTRHCVYGLDADLIMLALSTHEPRFVVLREVVFQPAANDNKVSAAQALIQKEKQNKQDEEQSKPQIARKPYQFLLINVLREYLEKELRVPVGFELDKERLYDDFVFMCFFVGNDFLPHMPTLEIREGAIDLLMVTYKKMLPALGYLVDGPNVLLDRVEKFITEIGQHEDAIFQKRMRLLRRQKDRRKHQGNNNFNKNGRGRKFESSKWGTRTPAKEIAQQAVAVASHMSKNSRMEAAVKDTSNSMSNISAAQELRSKMKQITGKKRASTEGEEQESKKIKADDAWKFLTKNAESKGGEDQLTGNGASEDVLETKSLAPSVVEAEDLQEAEEHVKDIIDPVLATTESEKQDIIKQYKEKLKEQAREKADQFDAMVEHEERIRLGEPGFKQRYYCEKLKMQPGPELDQEVYKMVKSYVEGLCWVMRYYYDGVASWTWYYPHHYAPFASDLASISSLDIEFDVGEPFKPFDQLMGVLPAASAHALPEPYRPLFTDSKSPILDFYPNNFEVDMNGKRFAWQGVALLPFIDESRLLNATREKENQLSDEEKFRNSKRLETLFVSGSHPLAPDVHELAASVAEDASSEDKRLSSQEIDTTCSDGMSGYIMPPNGEACPLVIPVPFSGLGEDITTNTVVCCVYLLPEHKPHQTSLLPGAYEEPATIVDSDIQPDPQLWHESHRGPRNGGYHHHNNYNNQPRPMVDSAGHRMVRHHHPGYRPPPPRPYAAQNPYYRPQQQRNYPYNGGVAQRPMQPQGMARPLYPGVPAPPPAPGSTMQARTNGHNYRSNNPYTALQRDSRRSKQ